MGGTTAQYSDPRKFLYILRRHAVTAAFSHPKYGGNVGTAGWAYLAEQYPNPATGRASSTGGPRGAALGHEPGLSVNHQEQVARRATRGSRISNRT